MISRERRPDRNSHALLGVSSVLLGCALLLATGCGGGGSTANGGSNFILVSVTQGGQDNLPLNTPIRFRFSSPVNPDSVGPMSIQIRKGDAFGLSIPGSYRVDGSEVVFEPRLPGLCDFSDSGFEPATTYRVAVVGYPEAFSLRSVNGTPLNESQTYEFRTNPDGSPSLLEDQIPGVGPTVVTTSPTDGTAAVTREEGNEAVIVLSENVHPCSVSDDTVLVYEYQRGNPATFQPGAASGNASGFVTPTASGVDDATPSDPFTWGATNAVTTLAQPQKVLCDIVLLQSFSGTTISIRPQAGTWPDNALIVIELTFGIQDFGGLPLAPYRCAFTTENETSQAGARTITWEGETPVDDGFTTADVNTPRAPSKAQGYMLFAGDGDNGANLLAPGKPETAASACTLDRQANDGSRDAFDPTANDILFDTGLANTCANGTDGSNAVVWEFSSFRLRSGKTLRIIGANPAILLVQGDVLIEAGARILVRGDGSGGSPQGRGANGPAGSTSGGYPSVAPGGAGTAGGGSGGSSVNTTSNYGEDGVAGFGSPQAGIRGGLGAGKGNSPVNWAAITNPYPGASGGGGGGGHSEKGVDGGNNNNTSSPFSLPARGNGGDVYPTTPKPEELRKPSAGSGGGAGGYTYYASYYYSNAGGAGGAGGGFLDITAGGDIRVFGTIDAAGSRGGNGSAYYYIASGGGGGGSGGGVRLLTPNDIDVTGGTITAAGGAGGACGVPTAYFNGPPNPGGAGAPGRLCFEDGDSVITGMGAATIVPGEGTEGFYRSTFDATRFQSGGLTPQVVTQLLFMGPTSPSFQAPSATDFPETLTGIGAGPGAGIPPAGSRGIGATSILIEARGYPITPEGEPDLAAGTAYYTVGYFTDSGQESTPNWVPSAFPADVGPPPGDNAGAGIANLSGRSFLQVRITYFLPSTVGPFDPGPYLNTWNIRFTSDQ